MIWIIKAKNIAVTEYYFNILKEAADLICAQVIVVDSIRNLRGCKSFDLIIVGNIVTATNYAYYYGDVLVKHDKGISDEIFVMLDNRSKTSCPMLEHFISTSEFADCHIWLMVKKSYSGKNKLKVEFNKEESEDIVIDNKKWKWIKVPVTFKLTAGQWPLYIKNTDGSVCVDKILFSFDPNFSPK